VLGAVLSAYGTHVSPGWSKGQAVSTKAWVALVLFALAGMVLTYYATGWRDLEDWSVCEQEYAAARSAADSAQIDLAPAHRERGRGEHTKSAMLTCGEYRRQHHAAETAT